jgi:NitT/TauT family transport system permease protein
VLVVGFGVFLALWQHVGMLDALIVARPTSVVRAFFDWFTNPVLRGEIPVTLEEAGISFVLAMVVATLLAGLLAYSKVAAALAAPYIALWNAVPKIALAPVFVFAFGLGLHAKVYFVTCATFITPFFAIYRGLTTVEPTMLAHARILGATRRQVVRDVYFPSCVGTTLAVLRVAIQFCLVAAVISEIVSSSSSGIGFMIAAGMASSRPNFLIAGALLVAVFGVVCDRAVRLAERRFLRWRAVT